MSSNQIACAAAIASTLLVLLGPATAIGEDEGDDLAMSGSHAPITPPARPATLAPAAGSSQTPNDGSYCGRQLGSWFYCEAQPQDAEASAETPAAPSPPEIAELEAYQKALEDSRQVAIWNPTPDNVERYIRLQKIALDKSGLFSDLWRRAIWTHPDLDYTLQRPTTQVAKAEFDNERTSDRDIFLRTAAEEFGVFYVYSGTCGPCKIASPIIKAFADRYGVNVKVIATDGAINPVFGKTLPDRGQLRAWGIDHEVTPALLIFQSATKIDRQGELKPLVVDGGEGRRLQLRPCLQPRGCLTYLGAGVMSVEDIAERAFVLLSKDPGTDY